MRSGRPIRVARLAATTWGQGPSVLLLHGWQGSQASMTAFVAPLVRAGYRVVSLDAPAHGQSPGRALAPYGYADAVLRVGESLGPLEAVIAHSYGGFALLNALYEGLRIKRAVLLAPLTTHVMTHPMLASRLFGLHQASTQRLLELSLNMTRTRPVPPDGLGERLNLPGLIVHDPADITVPFADSLGLAERWRNARLEVRRGVGHNRILSDQGVVALAVDFIRAGQPSPASSVTRDARLEFAAAGASLEQALMHLTF